MRRLLLILALLAGCASHREPKNWLLICNGPSGDCKLVEEGTET